MGQNVEEFGDDKQPAPAANGDGGEEAGSEESTVAEEPNQPSPTLTKTLLGSGIEFVKEGVRKVVKSRQNS